MAFSPRTYTEILDEMIAHVQRYTTVSDFTPGSVVRTILEASALEDDEQYFQMVQLLDIFSINTATGGDLDRRMADFGLIRLSAKAAIGKVRFYDSNLIQNSASQQQAVGSTSVVVFDSSNFPTTGFPYNIRVAEGTSRVMNLTVIGNDIPTGTFTLTGGIPNSIEVNNALGENDRVALVTGSVSRSIGIGIQVQVPANNIEAAKLYTSQEQAFIVAGNYFSNEVTIKANATGTGSNVQADIVTQFFSAAPFTGAGVINNTSIIDGGRARETDDEFRTRGLNAIQSLSRGTPLALKTYALGVEDPITGESVTFASVQEDFQTNEVIVYVTAGAGFTPDISVYDTSTLTLGVGAGASVLTVADSSLFASSGQVLVTSDGTNDPELIAYSSKDSTAANTLDLDTPTVNPHLAALTQVIQVDLIEDNAEAGQRRFNVTNYPVTTGTFELYSLEPGSIWTQLTENTDFYLDRGTGQIQILDSGGVPSTTEIVASYSYYTNLIAEVQKVLEGDSNDPQNYPGVKAAGIRLIVSKPIDRIIVVTANITADEGYTEDDLAPLVQQNIENYISNLGIGGNVVVAKMVDVAFNVVGVADINISTPTSNITVFEDELPTPFNTSGESQVSII